MGFLATLVGTTASTPSRRLQPRGGNPIQLPALRDNRMKDSALLLIAAASFGVLSWGIWHYFRADAPSVISMLMVIGLIADNARLRRLLRSKRHRDD